MGKRGQSFMDRTQRDWLRALDARLRSAHAHEVAAALSARMQDHPRAAAEADLAEAERLEYAAALAAHPEWVRRGSVRTDGGRLTRRRSEALVG